MKTPFSGGCACGRIRYTCQAAPVGSGHCHCRDCQRSSGTSHTSIVVVPSAGLAFQGGSPVSYESLSDKGNTVYRSFCGHCGSPMFAGNKNHPEFIAIKAASLDEPDSFQPAIDSWVSSAPAWCQLSPDTVKFERDIPQ